MAFDRKNDEQLRLREVISRLRAELCSTANYLEMVLADGLPAKGRTAAAREAWTIWHEDRGNAVVTAQRTLAQTVNDGI